MKVIVTAKSPFEVKQFTSVTNIAYTNGNYVITVSGTTYSYAAADYTLMII